MVKLPQAAGVTRERKSRRAGCLLLVFAVVAVATAISLFNLSNSEPLQISKETTYVTGPLTSDGKRVDYFATIDEQFSPENVSEANGFRLIVQRVVASADVEPWFFEQVCQKLGLDADKVRPDLTYEEPHVFLASFVESEEFDLSVVERLWAEKKSRDNPSAGDASRDQSTAEGTTSPDGTVVEDDGVEESSFSVIEDPFEPLDVLHTRTNVPWTLDDLPMMTRWLTKNGPVLDLLGEAVRKPTFHIPLVRRDEKVSLIAILLPNVQTMRSYARGLTVRATPYWNGRHQRCD